MPTRFDSAARSSVTVDGATISLRGETGSVGPTVLFVHGGLAHSGWWAHILERAGDGIPNWAAMDLSGHGDSDWRELYDAETWGAEVIAVARASDRGAGCILVGHSLGAMLSLIASARVGAPLIRGVVAVDGVPAGAQSPISQLEPSQSEPLYQRLRDGAEHFSSRPARANWPDALAHAVGEQSLRETEQGWVWKHDGRRRDFRRPHLDSLGALDVERTALILGGASRFAADIAGSDLVRAAGPALQIVTIDGAGHDLMMERGAEFTDALQEILAKFRSDTPERG